MWNYRHHPHVSTFCLATWDYLMSPLTMRSHKPFPFIFAYCKACKWSKTGWWIGLRTRLQHGSQVNHQVGLDTYDELNVLWEMHMEAEGSLTVARPKGATQCSAGHSNSLNMPKTGGREDTDLAEMALEAITDIIQLDIDCCWSWWGQGKCDS